MEGGREPGVFGAHGLSGQDRGFRVELGEIEAALRGPEGVQEAVVVAAAERGEEKRLVGYVTAGVGERVEGRVLRQGLQRKLPEYMVPVAVMVTGAVAADGEREGGSQGVAVAGAGIGSGISGAGDAGRGDFVFVVRRGAGTGSGGTGR